MLVIKPIVQWQEPGDIEVLGEVRFPGKYPIHQGETLYSVLQRAGGLTDVAFPYGAVFIREELKKREKDQLELLANRMQGDLAALSLEAVSTSSGVSGAGGGSASAGSSRSCDRLSTPAISCATRSRSDVSSSTSIGF